MSNRNIAKLESLEVRRLFVAGTEGNDVIEILRGRGARIVLGAGHRQVGLLPLVDSSACHGGLASALAMVFILAAASSGRGATLARPTTPRRLP